MCDAKTFCAMRMGETGANALIARVQKACFLLDRGIEVYAEPADPLPLWDGSVTPSVFVMVRASTDRACGMGVGFLVAISEGIWEGLQP